MESKSAIAFLSKGACHAFSYILHNQNSTRSDLCKSLNVGPATVGKYTDELLSCSMIKEVGFSESSGGRRPIVYSVNDSDLFILCINISTIYCEVAISDFKLNLHSIRHFKIQKNDDPEYVILKIIDSYNAMVQEMDISFESVIGAGVILFGAMKDKHGSIYKPIIQYMDSKWYDFPILDRLKSVFSFPVIAEKGITATASLEYNYGMGKSCKSMLYILCAMNIRSAFVVDGKVRGNSPFYEDAFGHMVVDFDGPVCQCGQYGCLNCFSSIPSIVESFKNRVKVGQPTNATDDIENVSIEDICKAATDGDGCAISVITEKARILGIALANYINVTTPELVLLSGLLIELSPLYFDVAVSSAKEHLKKTGFTDVEFRKEGSFLYPLTTSGASLVLDNLF